ncbi:MAG: Panacea domain-containing protein [Endozoicomonas sp.]|uniref:Panacea domain-containing protein n=1 Tax=Endozoicomonas sp. TaxID=1892382 RepID=UPI003D9B8E9B
MKLQKAVYCAYGWWLLQDTDQRLTHETPQAWQHGPVFPSLYAALKHQERVQGSPFFATPVKDTQGRMPRLVSDSSSQGKFLADISKRYWPYSGVNLVALTHRKGSPWHRIAKQHGFDLPRQVDIPDPLIEAEFRYLQSDAAS